MKTIIISQGNIVFVDDEDYNKLSVFKLSIWKQRNQAYACRELSRHISKKKTMVFMHHDIMGKPPRGLVTDHIDGNGLNNQKCNLRFVTIRQNVQNKHIIMASRFPGVTWSRSHNKWRSRIWISPHRIHLGYFNNELDAFNAYKKAVNNLGEEVIYNGTM
jgi:hypothetical protein